MRRGNRSCAVFLAAGLWATGHAPAYAAEPLSLSPQSALSAAQGWFSAKPAANGTNAAAAVPAHVQLSLPEAQAAAPVVWAILARSVEGRVIEYAQFGDGSKQVLVVGSLAGDEPEGVALAESLADHLARFPRRLNDVRVTIVRDPNPDGRARGTSGNAHSVDIDHNFATSDWRKMPANNLLASGKKPETEPETRALADLLADLQPDRVIVLGTSSKRAELSFKGPADALAKRICSEAELKLTPYDPIRHTGSLATLTGKDRQIPTLIYHARPCSMLDDLWAPHKRALLTAVGCGTPTDFPPIAHSGSAAKKQSNSAVIATPVSSPTFAGAPATQPWPQPAAPQATVMQATGPQPPGMAASAMRPLSAGPFPQIFASAQPAQQPGMYPPASPTGPQPLSFSELKFGRPAVRVVSPRTARLMSGQPAYEPGVPTLAPVPTASPSALASQDPPAAGSAGAPLGPRIRRLPPVDMFQRQRRVSLPPAMPQDPIPVYPDTGIH
jgi:protein MpaA